MPIQDFQGLGKKQLSFLENSVWSDRPVQFLYGSVRSGKNFVGAIRLAMFLANEPFGYENSDFVFCGASIKAVYRILLKDLFDLIGPENYKYNRQDGSGRIFNRDFYSFGFCKANSVEPLRGMSLGGLAGTEATFCHEDFYDETNLRLSYPGSKAFWDTNPGSPNHYLKKILDDPEKSKEIEAYHFLLENNPFIRRNKAYIRKLYRMYPPGTLLHKRMILGEWAMAEGVIYDSITSENKISRDQLPSNFDSYYVGVDYGTQNPCVFLLISVKGNVYYIIREYYYSGRETGIQQTPTQYRQDFKAWLGGIPIKGVFIDPSATYFITEMEQAGYPVEQADNSVDPGIKCLAELFAQNRLKYVAEDCPKFDKEITSYAWDKKRAENGKEQPLKTGDHGPDAARYTIFTLEDGREEEESNTEEYWEELIKEYAA